MMLAGIPCGWRMIIDLDGRPVLCKRGRRAPLYCVALQPLTVATLLRQVERWIATATLYYRAGEPALVAACRARAQLEGYAAELRSAA